jgi:hypothetical protein
MAPLRTFSRTPVLWLDNLAEVSIQGQPIMLCHYALRVWNRLYRLSQGIMGSWGNLGVSD